MEKTVIFRDRQEFQAADPNNLQDFARASLDHLVLDAVSSEKRYTGFQVTQSSTTQVTVAPGRYYNGGEVYVNELAQAIQLLQYLPNVTKKIVAIVAWGQDVDEDVQPRDFILDLTSGATEPQAVAMRSTRYCQINPLPGVEAADPQPPVIQTGTVAVALVTLGTGGIENIEMQGDALLPNLEDHSARIGDIEDWRRVIDPRVIGLASDLSALAAKTATKAERAQVLEIAVDTARIKERLDLPTEYVSYDADDFNDGTKSDEAGSGYACRTKYGLLFPVASSATIDLALFNPIEPLASIESNGMVLPKYTHTPIMATTVKVGDLGIASYQSQTHVQKKVTCTKHYHHYGWHHNFRLSWFSRFFWKHNPLLHWLIPWHGFLHHHHVDHYEWDTVSTNITGCTMGKDFLLPNSRWITKVGLNLTAVGASGDLRVMITGTKAGKPDLTNVLAETTVTQANLKVYPLQTDVVFTPVFLEGGNRYAVVLMTSGDHRTAVCSSTVSAQNPTQGQLWYSQDADWFIADSSKDLLFTLYGAAFQRTRTAIQLQAVSLSGGITDIEIEAQSLVPQGTDLQYEIQPSGAGAWYPLGDATSRLASTPNLVNLRVVFNGTTEVQPAIFPTPDAILASRPDVSLVHWADARTISSAVTDVMVKYEVSYWDGDHHTLIPKLKISGSEIAASASSHITLPDGAELFTFTWTGISPATTAYQLVTRGTRDSGTQPFAISERIDVAVS